MRRKLKNLKNKSGDSQNGSPRQLIDEATYRSHRNNINANAADGSSPHWDPQYSGWSNATRSRDHAIFLRGGAGPTGATGPTGPTQFVDLLSAGDFAIFAQSGISDTLAMASIVNGDMGINPAADTFITNFALVLDGSLNFSTSAQVFPGPPPQLGQVFAPGPSYSPATIAKVVQASADMITAYNDAIGRVPDFPSVGIDISTVSPLTAGFVYRYTGPSSIAAGPLTINGGVGDGIIIQVIGTLNIQNNVTLAGGILPENVYWAVTGVVTVDPGFTVPGTILAATLIAMGAGAILDGRALAQTAVTLDTTTVNEP